MNVSTVIEMDYFELDTLIKDLFPKMNYEFVADEEASNQSSHKFEGVTKEFFNRRLESPGYKEDILKLVAGKKISLFQTQIILEYLAWLEIIPEGDYLINVYW